MILGNTQGENMLINILLLITGFALLIKGADYFVDGASAMAAYLKIPAIIVGLTVVAMGTSAPEAAISISSAMAGSNAIAIGNVMGSNIANIFLILGISALITTLTVQKNTVHFEMPFMIFITLLLCWIGHQYGIISHTFAGILLGLFLIFLVHLFIIARGNTETNTVIKQISITKIILFIVLGLLALIFGSKITVLASVDIAKYIGISERIIGLTVVALGTSLPELVTSIIAARKGESDIAIGNIVGSNIFNILFVLGVAGLILPIPFDHEFLFDSIFAITAAVLLFLATFRHRKLGTGAGVLFIILYTIYVVWLCM
jgi:cation:H+ antiporter